MKLSCHLGILFLLYIDSNVAGSSSRRQLVEEEALRKGLGKVYSAFNTEKDDEDDNWGDDMPAISFFQNQPEEVRGSFKEGLKKVYSAFNTEKDDEWNDKLELKDHLKEGLKKVHSAFNTEKDDEWNDKSELKDHLKEGLGKVYSAFNTENRNDAQDDWGDDVPAISSFRQQIEEARGRLKKVSETETITPSLKQLLIQARGGLVKVKPPYWADTEKEEEYINDEQYGEENYQQTGSYPEQQYGLEAYDQYYDSEQQQYGLEAYDQYYDSEQQLYGQDEYDQYYDSEQQLYDQDAYDQYYDPEQQYGPYYQYYNPEQQFIGNEQYDQDAYNQKVESDPEQQFQQIEEARGSLKKVPATDTITPTLKQLLVQARGGLVKVKSPDRHDAPETRGAPTTTYENYVEAGKGKEYINNERYQQAKSDHRELTLEEHLQKGLRSVYSSFNANRDDQVEDEWED